MENKHLQRKSTLNLSTFSMETLMLLHLIASIANVKNEINCKSMV